MLTGKNILLVVTGGIAAYKALELIRLVRKHKGTVRCILTEGGAQFVTPLSVASLSEHEVYTDLWSLKDETEMGHIRLSRESDLIVVAPASADFLTKMAHGTANDLASTCVLASDKPVIVVPAMNPQMWMNAATQANVKVLHDRGVLFCGPQSGDMACGEVGEGRMSEAVDVLDSILSFFHDRPLKGLRALVTSGPTYEPIDPVRFLGNRSSGRQGHAIAAALYAYGAEVTLVSGPVAMPDPVGVRTIHVQTALEMEDACEAALPADIAVCAAAVSDWRVDVKSPHKIKKQSGNAPPVLELVENPDILAGLSQRQDGRPSLVIGFAAETNDLLSHAQAKLKKKGCDILLANEVGPDVSGAEKTFGSASNHLYFVTPDHIEEWPEASKEVLARKLADVVVQRIGKL